jgi:hypothetical protein
MVERRTSHLRRPEAPTAANDEGQAGLPSRLGFGEPRSHGPDIGDGIGSITLTTRRTGSLGQGIAC